MPFVYRDFCEAYNQAPTRRPDGPRLEQRFGTLKLLGTIKELAKAKTMTTRPVVATTGRVVAH